MKIKYFNAHKLNVENGLLYKYKSSIQPAR